MIQPRDLHRLPPLPKGPSCQPDDLPGSSAERLWR
jgi:hypothetical protein